jgi:hypothetical protein
MRRGLILAVVLAAAAGSAVATPLIWRGAGVLKPMQLIGQLNLSYSQTSRKYDWTGKEWVDQSDAEKTTTIKGDLMVGFSPLKNLEVQLYAPVMSKSQGDDSSMGLGDAWFKARYGILQGKILPVKLAASGAVAFPTAAEGAKPSLGDRTLDFGLGLIAQTQKLAGFVVHARLGYWLNGTYEKMTGEVEQTYDVGDMLEYVAKVDYYFAKNACVFVSALGSMQGRTEVEGDEVANSEKELHSACVGAVWQPIPILSVRPKVTLPLEFVSRGGPIPAFTPGLDFWVTLP